jgi:hypothetical protein
MNNNMNSLKTDMIKDNQDFNERFEALYEKIDTKSRLSSRASSRATSPKQLRVREKLPEFELPLETPRGQYPEVQVSMTEIFRDAKAKVERSVNVILPQSTDQATQS